MNYSPINSADGCIVIPAGADWRQLAFPGAELDTIPVAVPLEAQAAVIYALNDMLISMSPQAVPTDGYMELGAGCVLPVYDRTQLQQLVFSASSECVIQFFTGSTGLLPVPTPAVVPSGGGGGGGVATVGAYAPLLSTGGADPIISISAGANRDVLQFDGSTWAKRTSTVGRNIFVDNVVGNDATAQVYNPFRPYLTIQAAHTAATAGDTIIIRSPGTYAATGFAITKCNVIGPTAQLTGPVEFGGSYLLDVRQISGDLILQIGSMRIRTRVIGSMQRAAGASAITLNFIGQVTGTYTHGANMVAIFRNSELGKLFIGPSSDWEYRVTCNYTLIGSMDTSSPAMERTTTHGFSCLIELNKCILISGGSSCIATPPAGLMDVITRDTVVEPNVVDGPVAIMAQNNILA